MTNAADLRGNKRINAGVCLNEHIDRLNAALQGRYTIRPVCGSAV